MRSHRTGEVAWTDARGVFALDAGAEDDVLVVARAGGTEATVHAPAGGAAEMRVVLRPEPSSHERVLQASLNGTLDPAIALGGQSRAGPLATPLRIPFRIDPDASGLRIELAWTPTRSPGYGDVILEAAVAAPDDALSTIRARGPSPLVVDLPQSVVLHHPGDWEVVVRPADSLATRVLVEAQVWMERGPVLMKRVQGAPPHVASPLSSQAAGAPATMDVLGVTITNESVEAFDVRLDLAQVGTMEASRLAYAHWVVHWRHGGARYFAAVSAHPREAQDARGEALDFSAGDCLEICRKKHTIVGAVEWGTPGSIRLTIPKAAVGSPPDGTEFLDLGILVYESLDDVVVEAPDDPSLLVVERAEGGRPYRLGPAEYALPPDVRAALLERTHGGAERTEQTALARVAAPSSTGGWLAGALVAAALVAVGAGYAWTRSIPAATPRGGRYERIRDLGQGANGRVVLARHALLGHLVAIKETFQDDPGTRERLLREARVLARVSDPHVVRIFDVEERADGLAIVMEYVEGGSLRHHLEGGRRFSTLEAATLWRDVLQALAAAHAAGIVHRDVKPANVLLTAQGEAKLGDFGVARTALDETLGAAGNSALVGTPLYMAPEQLRGEPATPASDVYAAAALAFELFTGRRFVDLTECRSAWDVLLASPRRSAPGALADIPAELRDLVARCVAERAEARGSAAELVEALDARLARLTATR